MPEPILTIGELEPERPTVRINHVAPDSAWQRFKDRHVPFLTRWFPVRYTKRSDLYGLRHPTEFGMRDIARISNAQRAIAELREEAADEGTARLVERQLREVAGLVLEAPAEVIDQLSPSQHIQVLVAFNASAMGATPTRPTGATENPSTSAGSSPASTASTVPGTG